MTGSLLRISISQSLNYCQHVNAADYLFGPKICRGMICILLPVYHCPAAGSQNLVFNLWKTA